MKLFLSSGEIIKLPANAFTRFKTEYSDWLSSTIPHGEFAYAQGAKEVFIRFDAILRREEGMYPEPECKASGLLAVGDKKHEIYWHEYGRHDGEPVMFLHGGPGGATKSKNACFFDPDRYRIILFDQRGCGQSKPNAGTDPESSLGNTNTTEHLIRDIEELRTFLDITDKMHVFGGSWGATLALAYAIKHADHVKTLILRGIFLCRRQDLDYLYQGNAATYTTNFLDGLPGAYSSNRKAWDRFVKVIDEGDRHDMVVAYSKIFNDLEHPKLKEAVTAWSVWEGACSSLKKNQDLSKYEDPDFAPTFARIENHYFLNGGFFEGRRREHNYLLEELQPIVNAKIPIHIVQGEFDEVCPKYQAEELVAELDKKGHPKDKLNYLLTNAGHSQFEPETAKALTNVMDGL